MAVEPKKRVDATNAERQRRFKAKKRAEAALITPVTLSANALLAERHARAVLGSDFDRFEMAVQQYVLAVDVADHARSVWVESGRPMRDTFANGMGGVHPFFKAMETAAAQMARFAGELGLTPASAKRISGVRGAGRPVGAASAADRKAAPPLKLAQ